jgi:lipoprotein-releasing system ATP-binding protein
VVDDWTAHFDPGEVVAVTGPSGCGKSTRLYLLGLMLRLRAGRVELDGRRVDNLADADRAKLRARQFGFVFQDAALDPTRTVLDNVLETVLYSGADRREAIPRAHNLLEAMSVAVPPNRRPGQVSGGQAQRIAVCRALVGRPAVVIADEPTGNLDAVSGDAVLGMLRDHASDGATVVLVTHDPGIAQSCDRRIDLPPPGAHG